MNSMIIFLFVVVGTLQACNSMSIKRVDSGDDDTDSIPICCNEANAIKCPKKNQGVYEINSHVGEECSGIDNSQDTIVHHVNICSCIYLPNKTIKMYCEKNSEGDVIFKVFSNTTVDNKLWQYERFENAAGTLVHQSCKEQGKDQPLKKVIESADHVHDHHNHDHDHHHIHELHGHVHNDDCDHDHDHIHELHGHVHNDDCDHDHDHE
ncbi:uncharacterized protein LOC122852413 [Aphidius gifuensis]|uniref:uncharacterized protein LOC122852413 n=1 Tax=Aphidius gifuensis TaxID=684658 RepID=UPI001CDBC415|nr:uncharacterized protein LOC122852413 [Aphidius gifuensis]